MSAVESPNQSASSAPPVPSETAPPKKKLLARLRNRKRPSTHEPVSKGCHNCSHYLSAFTYWKPSPCGSCVRSAEHSFRIDRSNLVDNWEQISSRLASRMNVLY